MPQASTTVARVRVAVRDAAGTRLTDDSDSPITIQPAAAPSILSVTPASGPVAGGNQVTISGNGFTQGCVVRFGGTDAQVIGVTPSQVIAIAPAQAVAGPVNIRLVNPDGQFVVASSAYTYVAVALTVTVNLVMVLGVAVVGEMVTAGAVVAATAGAMPRPSTASAVHSSVTSPVSGALSTVADVRRIPAR